MFSWFLPCWVSTMLIRSCALTARQYRSLPVTELYASFKSLSLLHRRQWLFSDQYLSKHLDLCFHLLVLFIPLCIGHQTRRDTTRLGFNWPFLRLSWQLPGNQLTFHSLSDAGLEEWALRQRPGCIHALPTARAAAVHMLATDPHTGCSADVSWTCCFPCTNRPIFTSAIAVTHTGFLRAISPAQ